MTTPLIEAIALAVEECGPIGCCNIDARNAAEITQAALAAITQAGYAVVPVEPTEAMLSAGEYDDHHPQGVYFGGYMLAESWERMIKAAQGDGA